MGEWAIIYREALVRAYRQALMDLGQLDLGDARQIQRQSHVGFYLIGPGQEQLHAKVGFRPPLGWRRK